MTKERVNAVDRALTILDTFKSHQDAMYLKDIALATGFYKSTILRLLGSLEAFGYIRKSQSGQYFLGPTLWQLGNRYQQSLNMESQVRPVLKQLVEITGENASFYIRDQNKRVCLYRESSRQSIQHSIIEGEHLPLQRGAAGKILMAFTFKNNDPDGLSDIRARGYYYSSGERDRFTAAVAAPVFDHTGQCAGALAVSGLRDRFTEKALPNIKREVIRQAALLSMALGALPDE